MKKSEAIEAIKRKFNSGNSVPVERATITHEQFLALIQDEETWKDVVRRICNPLTDEQIESLLWACSSYPVGSVDQIKKGLAQSWKEGGCTYEGTMAAAEAKLDAALEAYHERNEDDERLL